MGSDHERLQRRADKRLAREHRKHDKEISTVNVRSAILRKPQPWTKPSFDDMPYPLMERDLEPLGEFKGRFWYQHRQLGELRERPGLLNHLEILPALPVLEIEVDGHSAWRVFDVSAPGTYENLLRTPVRAPKPPPPHRGIDVISTTYLGDRQPERILAPGGPASSIPNPLSKIGTTPRIKPAQPPAWGAEAVIERLRRNGAELRLSTDRQHVILTASGGRPNPGVVELFEAVQPLLLAHLRGGPMLCTVADHRKGDDPTAITLLVGGTPACARHLTDPIEATARGAA